MNIVNQPKMLIIGLIIVCATAALIVGRLTAVEWLATVGPFGGYLIGNGVAAKNNDPVQPAIGRRTATDD